MKINEEQAKKLRHDIMHDNKMLYCMHDRPCTETAMCWNFECGDGWLNAIDEMSMKLEALNYAFYPKFRVRIQMDQVKEKWGLCTCYYSVISDPPKWMCWWHRLFQKVFDRIAKLDFKLVDVLDHDAYDEVVEKELATKEEFEKEKKDCARCSNVEVLEKDGKFIRKATYHHYKKTHSAATKHKWLFKLLQKRYVVENWPMRLFNVEPTHKQQCIASVLEEKAREIVQKAEKDCYEVCEKCGQYISDDSEWSPRCTTRGWIAYLCKDCADKTGSAYVMNGAVWKDGKEAMSKKEYAEERAKIDARFKAAQEDVPEEEDDED